MFVIENMSGCVATFYNLFSHQPCFYEKNWILNHDLLFGYEIITFSKTLLSNKSIWKNKCHNLYVLHK